MKIVFLMPSNVAGGAERVMTSLANEFTKKDIDTYIIIFDRDTSFYKLETSVHLLRLGVDAKKRKGITKYMLFPLYSTRLYSKLKRIKPDVVISFLFLANVVGTFCCKALHIPIILSERSDPAVYKKVETKIMSIVYPKANGFVCQSNMVKEYVERHYGHKNSAVIPNPLSDVQIGLRSSRKSAQIIAVGRLIPQKNFEILIDAYAEMNEIKRDYKLIIYGEGPLRHELEHKIQKYKLDKRVQLPGVEHNVIKNHNDSALFILSSKFEGYPNVLIEAMANGIPVIASDIPTGVVREIVQDGYNGYIFKTGDKESLKLKIREALSDKDKLEKIGENGKRIRDILSLESVAEMWISYIEYIKQIYDNMWSKI